MGLFKWLGDTIESGRFYFGIILGFLVWQIFNYLKKVNFCGVFT